MEIVTDQWFPVVGGGKTGETQGIFRAVKPFCMTQSWWIHDIKPLSKLIEFTA